MAEKFSNAEIERMVLSAATYSSTNLLELTQGLQVTDFTEVTNKEVFFLLHDIYLETEDISSVIICQKAKDKGYLERVGGLQGLLSIITSASSSCDLKSYIEYLKELTALRDIRDLFKNQLEKMEQTSIQSRDLIENVRERLNRIDGRSTKSDLVEIDVSYKEGFEGKSYSENIVAIQDSRKDGKTINGLETGFTVLDKVISGFGGGNLILLAARPGMGKTTLALNMFCHSIYEKKIPALFVSMEMGEKDLLDKIASSRLSIDYSKIRDSIVSNSEFQEIVEFERGEHLGLLTFGRQNSLNEIRNACIRAKEAHGIKLVVIDYVQLLSNGKNKSDNRNQEISEISRGLKLLATSLNIPIICLSQLSRKVDDRLDQIPVLGDLRDSGALEADADIVLFIHRYDHKDPNNKPGKAKLIVAKNRRGSICDIDLSHNLSMSRFTNFIPFEEIFK